MKFDSYGPITRTAPGWGWLIPAVLLCVAPAISAAQTTVFVVRHADREATEPDAALTAIGRRQAEALGALLKDAHITHIYTTEFQRTAQTAAPTARVANVRPEVAPQADLDQLADRIRRCCEAGEAVLVVGHRGTVPRIVKAIAGAEIQPLGSSEFDRLLVVTLTPGGPPSVVTLRYGATERKP